MSKPSCPVCGSTHLLDHGVDDGGGDYGSSLCQQYECEVCGYWFEDDCIETWEPPDDEPEPEHISWQMRAVEEALAEDEARQASQADLGEIPF